MPPVPRRFLILAAPALAACGRTAERAPARVAPPSPPIRLTVGSLDVQDQVQTLPLNFIDRRRSEEMVATTRSHLTQRIQAVGGADFGKAVIEEASLIEEVHPRGGVRGAIAGPERELVGVLAVRVAVTDGFGIESAYARARVELRRAVAETSSVMDRDRMAREMTADLLESLDRSLQSGIKENLAPYLVTS